MRLAQPAPFPRSPPQTLLPMIDVVLFLVIFFMIVARFTGAEPFAVNRPQSVATASGPAGFALFLSASGEAGLVQGGAVLTGEAALVALAAGWRDACARGCDPGSGAAPVLMLHADAQAPAAALAALLPRLAAMGFGDLRLSTVAR